MDEEAVFPPHLQRDLPCRLDKGLGFNVTYSAADFCDDHIRIRLIADAVHKILYFICDVRDDLHRRAEILAAALFVENVPIHLAGGEVGELVEVFVDEALIVAEVKVGLRAVLGDVHLAVLIGTHRAGVNVDIRVKLLRGDLEAARLEQTTERGGSDALAKPGDDAAGHKNVLSHLIHSLRIGFG